VKKAPLALLLLTLFFHLFAAGRTQTDSAEDLEQSFLELNYRLQNIYGIQLDTIQNQDLYIEILTWLGTPYKYSGNAMNGTDCSGFVSSIYKSVYSRSLGNSSCDIFEKDIDPLKNEDLKEGDLVFFKIRKKRISHVGIYLNNKFFVHASTKSGVIISSLTEPYYSKYYFKGGRVKPQ
jgi:lipoprotein Spr